uniref:Solute carrier family 26 member 3 n=1 Tax=Hucho hucho TaxID=62062 RepID=A0A4W5KF72_9TELE
MKQYVVTRPLYSEDAFTDAHEKIHRHHKTVRCDLKRTKNAALSLLPFIGWMRIYQLKEWLLSDIVSGVSTGLVAVLQGLAYSLLASLPPWYGLFTAFFPVIVYFFLGTSRHISVGKYCACVCVYELEQRRRGNQEVSLWKSIGVDARSRQAPLLLSQLAMGLLQVGFIVMYLSDTLVSGFTTAAAVHILVSQLKFVLGLVVPGLSGPLSIVYTLEKIFVQIEKTNMCDLVTSILIMVVVFIVKEINDRYKAKLPVPIPIEVIMTVIACGVSYMGKLSNDISPSQSVRYESPIAPNIQIFGQTAAEAFPMAIVGFAVAFSVAKVYSVKHDYIIDGNQVSPKTRTLGGGVGRQGGTEKCVYCCLTCISFGASNIIGAAFKSFAASTALSRSAVQESTGGKTQIAGLLSALIVMVVTLAIGFLLEPLPKSVLGAVVIVNLKGMLMQIREVPYLWRRDRPDCVVWLVTCLASILLGLDLGLAVGLGIELLTVVFRAQFPRCSVLANITGTDIYKDRKDYMSIYEPEGVKIFRIPSPIFFANIDFFRGKLVEVGFNPLRVLRKRNKALRTIRKLLKKGKLQMTSKGLLLTSSGPIEESEDESNMEDLDQPTDFKELPVQVNWNSELPANIQVPRVDVHSLILDFSAVSFLDISALKGLKALKELIRVEVEVYIVACDGKLKKLHSCKFFDDEVKSSMFFLTLHDAMLHVLEKHPVNSENTKVCKKV